MTRLLLVILGACCLANLARAADEGRIVLDNGLEIHLLPNASAQSVALVTLFDVGEWHDPPGKSGLSHMTEHMYVTAAAGEAYPARTAESWMRAYPPPLGTNAQTGEDYTVIATVFSPKDLAGEIAEAAARMSALTVTQEDMERELPRLETELTNMYGGMPALGAMNVARGFVRPAVDGNRKGGIIDAAKALTVDEVQAHYERYYKPGNAMLVLAGAFEAADAEALLREHFAPIDQGDALPEIGARGERLLNSVVTMRVEAGPWSRSAPYVVGLAYEAPAPDDRHYAAFLHMVSSLYMASMQDGGMRRATAPPVVFAPLDDPGVILFTAEADDREGAQEALKSIRERIRGVVPEEGEFINRMTTTAMFGPALGFSELPAVQAAGNPYFVAFAHGRRIQLGVDAAAIKAGMGELDAAAVMSCYANVFSPAYSGAVIVELEEGEVE